MKIAETLRQLITEKTNIIFQLAENYDQLYTEYFDVIFKNQILVIMLGLMAITTFFQLIYFLKVKRYWRKKHQAHIKEIRNEIRKFRNYF